MKLYLLVSLLGTALASTGQFSYSSFSTAHGPLARSALAYGGYASSALTEISGYSAAAPVYAAAPVTAYAAHAPFTAYAAHAPVTAYAAHAPVAAFAAHTPVTAYAAHAPAYAAAPVATYAATQVATAPATAVVPVTRVSAQPAVVQNVVDVAQPKLATRRFEIRRPAIEKQFYDVEERIVVRPAGSAVVELETPIGAGQRGPTKITAAAPPVALHSYNSAHLATHFTPAVLPAAPVAISAIHHHPQVVEQNQEYEQFQQQQEHVQQTGSEQQQISQQSESVQQIPQQPIPQPSLPQQDDTQQQFDDSESVSIDNPEISVRTGSIASTSGNIPSPLFRSQLSAFPRAEAPLPQFSSRQSFEQSNSDGLPSFSRSRVSHYLQPEPLPLPQQRSELPQQSTLRPEYASARQQQAEFSFAGNQFQVSSSRAGASLKQGPTSQRLLENDVEVNSFGSDRVVSSARHLSPEQSQANQARLIELLTARGPVSEVRSASEPIRGRVISATPAPSSAEPADERINTRRIVVNRPIQTVQEVDVVEPFTKLERVAVHQPAVVKSAHVELAAVPAAVHTAVPAAVTVAPYYHK